MQERDDLAYLESLVRMDIRRKERGVQKFAPKPGQLAEEAEAARQNLERALAYRKGVLARLKDRRKEIIHG